MGRYLILGMYLMLLARPGDTLAQNQIEVRLFGQHCRLTGNAPTESLKAVHEVSPGMIPPPERLEQVDASLKRLREVQNLPHALERYRKNMTLRFEGLRALFSAVDQFHRTRDGTGLRKLVEGFSRPRQRKFHPLLATLGVAKTPEIAPSPAPTPASSPSPSPSKPEEKPAAEPTKSGGALTDKQVEAMEKFIEFYRDSIQKDPEEEFHRTIRKLGIHYICDFDELEAGEEAASDSGDL